MSTLDPQSSAPPGPGDGPGVPPGEPAPKKHRNPWIWVSAVLALAAVGLLIWGVATRADLNSSEDDVSDLQTQVSNESAESEAAKGVAADLEQDLGATNEDLAATEQELTQAEQSQSKAEDDAATAKKDAAQAQNATEKAEADAKQAKAEADAAQSKTEIAGACARAYVSAFGLLFEGESVKSQAEVVRKELQSISAQCQKALSGA
jgi:F-type H+-transporting ATPase subunit b